MRVARARQPFGAPSVPIPGVRPNRPAGSNRPAVSTVATTMATAVRRSHRIRFDRAPGRTVWRSMESMIAYYLLMGNAPIDDVLNPRQV
jgi:hypothetical protein